MGELMRAIRMPAIDMMRLARENEELRERCEALEMSNKVLTEENDTWEKAYKHLMEKALILRDERNDARHERDALRARRNRAYMNAFTQNRIDRRGAKRIERALLGLITAAWAIPALIVLCGKAVEWARWLMGM